MKKTTVKILSILLSIVIFSAGCNSCTVQKVLNEEQEQLKKQARDAGKSE